MKLALEILGDDPAVAELKSDVAEMERMVHGYLDFARGEGTEAPVETDLAMLLDDIAAAMRREGTELSLDAPLEYLMAVQAERAEALPRQSDRQRPPPRQPGLADGSAGRRRHRHSRRR